MITYDVQLTAKSLIYDAERKLWEESRQGEGYCRKFSTYHFSVDYARGDEPEQTMCYRATGSASCTASFGFNIWNVEFEEVTGEEYDAFVQDRN